MKLFNRMKIRRNRDKDLVIEALKERNDYLIQRNSDLQYHINEMTKVFYINLRSDVTFDEAVEMLDDEYSGLKDIDTQGFLIDIILELGVSIDRSYLKELFDNEK